MSTENRKILLLNAEGEIFFTLLVQFFTLKIPIYMKKILILSGYDNIITLSKLNNEHICEIEEFMQNNFVANMMKENETIEQYLGIYKNSQKNFQFVSGHKVLLRTMSSYCKSEYKESSQIISSNDIGETETSPNDQQETRSSTLNLNIEPEIFASMINMLRNWIKNQESLIEVIVLYFVI